MARKVLIGDDINEDEIDESDGGDDNNDYEILLVETPAGLLVEPAITCLADTGDDEPHLSSADYVGCDAIIS